MKSIFTRIFLFIVFVIAAKQSYSQLTYCTPSVTNVANYGIGMRNVTLGSLNSGTTAATGNAPNYYDYTTSVTALTTTASATVTGSVSNGTSNTTMARIFIDYNRDGVFATTSPELVWTSTNTASSAVVTVSFTVPAGTTPGIYRIRVTGDIGSGSTANPCALGYGEVEDYTMVIVSSTADAAAYAFTSPTTFAIGNNTIAFNFRNLFNTTLNTVDVGYQLGSNTPVTQSLTGLALASGALRAQTFSTSLSVPSYGTYTLKTWVTNPNGNGTVTASNDTISRTFTICAPLSGTYTIDPSGSGSTNFTSFTNAVTQLKNCGISGPVIFNVAAATYTEQLDLTTISGSSSTNTVTFEGGNGNAASRILTAATTSALPYTFRMNGCSYVTLRNLTIRSTSTTDGWPVNFLNGTFNRVNNCVVEISASGATSTNSNLTPVVINGSSTSMSAQSTLVNNITVDSCTLAAGYQSVYCASNNGANVVYINKNTMNSAYYYGVYFNGSVAAKITNNTITVRSNNSSNYGIYLVSCNASGTMFHEINSNKIYSPGQYGIYLNSSSGGASTTFMGQLYNNMIGGVFRATSGVYGIYTTSASLFKIYHNSIYMDANTTTGNSAAISLNNGSNLDVRNNIFAIMSPTAVGAYPAWLTSASVVNNLNYNNYFNTSSINLLNIGGADINFLNFRTAGGGASSINSNPSFVSNSNLHVTNPCNDGFNLGISTDIDGNTRSTTPDMGADEVTTPASNDIGMLKINNPGFPMFPGLQSINVTLRNYGSNTITTASVNYQVDGGSIVTESWSGSLAPCDTANFTFSTTYNFSAGANVLKVYTTDPNGVTDPNAANDTLQRTYCPGMSGIYTIDPAGSGATNFTTFNNAVSALLCGGVYGPVVFNIASGTYTEQVQISYVLGSSPTNTITFQSATGIASNVTLTYNSTNANLNYTLKLNGALYIDLKNFTIAATNTNYGTAFNFAAGASYDSLFNMVLNGITTTSTSQNYAVIYNNGGVSNFMYFTGCTINNGSYGSYITSISSLPSSENLTFNNCDFVNQYAYGMYFQYMNGLRLTNNRIVTNSTYTSYTGMYNYWIMINTDANRPIITGNKISGAVGRMFVN